MSHKQFIKQSDIEVYFKDLAKEFRRLNGKGFCAEIILVGGAAILCNYGFRASTVDIDADIFATSAMKDAIRIIADRYNLMPNWINGDFTKTRSYTPKIVEYAKYYRTYANVVCVRTIAAEYLIAMKLMAGRKFKHDLSDVIGILIEHQRVELPLTKERIEQAVNDLYGEWDQMPRESKDLMNTVFESPDLEALYKTFQELEDKTREAQIQFNAQNPNVLAEDNLDEILQQVSMENETFSTKNESSISE